MQVVNGRITILELVLVVLSNCGFKCMGSSVPRDLRPKAVMALQTSTSHRNICQVSKRIQFQL
jgi:hypothetical protein